jgi:hypothetical protein
MRKVMVKLTRVYQFNVSDVTKRIDDEKATDNAIRQEAERMAYGYISDEMPEFIDNPRDFVSANTFIYCEQ